MSKTLSIYCEICSEKITAADIRSFSSPQGSQFLARCLAWLPSFGIRREEMRVLTVVRPFTTETAVLTANGMYEVPRTVAPRVWPPRRWYEAKAAESGPEKGEKRRNGRESTAPMRQNSSTESDSPRT